MWNSGIGRIVHTVYGRRKTTFDLAVFPALDRSAWKLTIAVGSCSRSRRIRNISVCENQSQRSIGHEYSVGVYSIAMNTHQKSDCLAVGSITHGTHWTHYKNISQKYIMTYHYIKNDM